MSAPSPARIPGPVALPRRQFSLRKHADYQRVYREGIRQSLPLMTYFYAVRKPRDVERDGLVKLSPSHGTEVPPGPRIGLTAGRVLGNAVTRNRIKRRMRQAIRQVCAELSADVDVVLHPRKRVLDAEYAEIERDVLRAFRAVRQALKSSRDTNPGHGD